MYTCVPNDYDLFLYVVIGDLDDSGNALVAIGVSDSFDVFFQSEHRNRSRRDVCLETRRRPLCAVESAK